MAPPVNSHLDIYVKKVRRTFLGAVSLTNAIPDFYTDTYFITTQKYINSSTRATAGFEELLRDWPVFAKTVSILLSLAPSLPSHLLINLLHCSNKG